jgi:hypothetical protein
MTNCGVGLCPPNKEIKFIMALLKNYFMPSNYSTKPFIIILSLFFIIYQQVTKNIYKARGYDDKF